MERFVKGDVVVLLFPYADLSNIKNRPALVVANIPGDDIIISQITTNKREGYIVKLNENAFEHGKLNKPSFIRPDKLFTVDVSLIKYKAGHLKISKIKEVEKSFVRFSHTINFVRE